MKIGNITEHPGPEGVGPAASRGGVSAGRPVAPVEASDQVKLSETTRTLGEPGSGPEIRADKVNAVREAIARGEYRVNSEAIAERLIIESAQLLETLSGAPARQQPTNPRGQS